MSSDMHTAKNSETQQLLEQNSRLEEQVHDFERLIAFLRKISSAANVEETLKQICEQTLQFCRADETSIILTDRKEPKEAKTLIRGSESGEEKLDNFLNRLLCGWIAVHKKPLLTNNLAEALGKDNIAGKYTEITSALCVPLVHEEKIIGVINLISASKERGFGEREQHLLEVMAPQFAQFIKNAHFHEKLFTETARLKREVQGKYALQGIIGGSPKMQAVFALLDSIIPTDVRVLIQGESGTGKERIARAIHYSGPLKDAPFVAVDCGALPTNLLESELFGYVKGAFTGASQDRIGLFEDAHGGTLFLDEISNMAPEIQMKFLRAIQEGEFRPLGSSKLKKVEVRIIAASSESLQEKLAAGEFRQDLYYRINVVTVTMPPLRERAGDIVILASHFLEQNAKKYNKTIKGFDPKVIAHLESHSWPGNIRELENAVERAVVLCRSDEPGVHDFPFLESVQPSDNTILSPRPLQEAVDDYKKSIVSHVLEQTGGNQTKAAKILKVNRSYLNQLLKKFSE